MHSERPAWRGLQRDDAEASIALKSSAGIPKVLRTWPADARRADSVRSGSERYTIHPSAHFHIAPPAVCLTNKRVLREQDPLARHVPVGMMSSLLVIRNGWGDVMNLHAAWQVFTRRVQPSHHVALWAAVHEASWRLLSTSRVRPLIVPGSEQTEHVGQASATYWSPNVWRWIRRSASYASSLLPFWTI